MSINFYYWPDYKDSTDRQNCQYLSNFWQAFRQAKVPDQRLALNNFFLKI
jgi:predicted lipoprotein